MTPFLSYENYKACAENRIDVLKMAIKQGWDISSEVVEDIVNENIFKHDSTVLFMTKDMTTLRAAAAGILVNIILLLLMVSIISFGKRPR